MKKITFPVVLFLLAACSSNNESRQTEETVATVVTVDETVPDTLQVDAVTSATSKPNQVSFNGTMVIPPQRHGHGFAYDGRGSEKHFFVAG